MCQGKSFIRRVPEPETVFALSRPAFGKPELWQTSFSSSRGVPAPTYRTISLRSPVPFLFISLPFAFQLLERIHTRATRTNTAGRSRINTYALLVSSVSREKTVVPRMLVAESRQPSLVILKEKEFQCISIFAACFPLLFPSASSLRRSAAAAFETRRAMTGPGYFFQFPE